MKSLFLLLVFVSPNAKAVESNKIYCESRCYRLHTIANDSFQTAVIGTTREEANIELIASCKAVKGQNGETYGLWANDTSCHEFKSGLKKAYCEGQCQRTHTYLRDELSEAAMGDSKEEAYVNLTKACLREKGQHGEVYALAKSDAAGVDYAHICRDVVIPAAKSNGQDRAMKLDATALEDDHPEKSTASPEVTPAS